MFSSPSCCFPSVAGVCGVAPPATDEIRRAYAEHVEADRVHERGLQAKEAPVVIPQQEASCSRDGRTHFDCRIRVIFETDAEGTVTEWRVGLPPQVDYVEGCA